MFGKVPTVGAVILLWAASSLTAGCGAGSPATTPDHASTVKELPPVPGGPQPLPCAAPWTPGTLGGAYFNDKVFSVGTTEWSISSHCQGTEVIAGSSVRNRSTGLIELDRSTIVGTKEPPSPGFLIPGAGPLTITRAPLGKRAKPSAWYSGMIEFKGRAGITGKLRLHDDRITLECPGTCPRVVKRP